MSMISAEGSPWEIAHFKVSSYAFLNTPMSVLVSLCKAGIIHNIRFKSKVIDSVISPSSADIVHHTWQHKLKFETWNYRTISMSSYANTPEVDDARAAKTAIECLSEFITYVD